MGTRKLPTPRLNVRWVWWSTCNSYTQKVETGSPENTGWPGCHVLDSGQRLCLSKVASD